MSKNTALFVGASAAASTPSGATVALLLPLFLLGSAAASPAGPPVASPAASKPARFLIRGDGTLKIRSIKNNYRFEGRYREGEGHYRERALRLINKVFDGNYRRPESRISLRFIELLAHLQQEHQDSWIILSSGYRSPRYNSKLRQAGGVVAKASLHQFGMAADLRLPGVRAIDLWGYFKGHQLGGTGYYRSKWVHLDVGPARFWTQRTAKVRGSKATNNSHLLLVPEYDVYLPGEQLRLRLTRMTSFPLGIPRRGFTLERAEGASWRAVHTFSAHSGPPRRGSCLAYSSIAKLADLRWRLPAGLPPGRYRVSVAFCHRQWEEMPAQVSSPAFQLRE